MQNKRGISQVITTILFILIGILAIGIIWVTIDSVFLNEARGLSLTPLTLDLEIESAFINTSTYQAIIKVARNPGEGEIKSIKFIIEDNENAEVYEEIVEGRFPELSKRTFYLDLTNTFLNIHKIHKISIAPVYYVGQNEIEKIGRITDYIGNLAREGGGNNGEREEEIGQFCDAQNPCPESKWIGATTCNAQGTGILQDRMIYSCENGFCVGTITTQIKQFCGLLPCLNGLCVEQPTTCTPETIVQDCGADGPIGPPLCRETPTSIIQNYRNYSCNNNICSSSTTFRVIRDCPQKWVCRNAECFEPLECTTDQNCIALHGLGKVCELGLCVNEQPLAQGIVNSAWPFNIGEYFDSYDLPMNDDQTFTDSNVIFLTSSDASPELRCLKIVDHNYFEGSIPYIRLEKPITNVSAGDRFQIWKTLYGCTLI